MSGDRAFWLYVMVVGVLALALGWDATHPAFMLLITVPLLGLFLLIGLAIACQVLGLLGRLMQR